MKPQSDLKPAKYLFALLVLSFTFLISCRDDDKQREFANISFTPDKFIEKENVLLDTIVHKIEYVILESGPGSYIGRITALSVTNDDILVLQFLYDGKSMYSWTDIRNDKTIIPVLNNEDKSYGFALSAFPVYPDRINFANGHLFGIIQPSDVMEYFDKDAEDIPADLKTKLKNITIDHNPVIMLGKS
ncbi:MAG: hypothetical protein ACQERS_12705 [Bacteroidota bacterium]